MSHRAPWLACMICVPLILASPVSAQDASFGCKVLLCAAATAPGWSSIPYCVPVMQSMFRQLARGKPWPVCSEGHSSGVGYEPWQPCPDGWVPGDAALVGRANGQTSASDAGSVCLDVSKPQQTCSGPDNCTTTYPSTPRMARENPYFVDIAAACGTQKFYFSLRGY